MMDLVVVECSGPGFLPDEPTVRINNRDNRLTPCQAYQEALHFSTAQLICYVHDDVTIHDPAWQHHVEEVFDQHPNCVVVGLGGALALGHPDLYKRPYRLEDMARVGYRSNQTDWQTHGERERGSCRVAVVDAFFMAVRASWLGRRRTLMPNPPGGDYQTMGFELGWPTTRLTHHCLDLWLACEATLDNKEVWMVGVECTHHGGGSSTKPAYREAKWLQGHSLESDHQIPHKFLYENYRGVLPVSV